MSASTELEEPSSIQITGRRGSRRKQAGGNRIHAQHTSLDSPGSGSKGNFVPVALPKATVSALAHVKDSAGRPLSEYFHPKDTVDTHVVTRWASAVVHERLVPTVHSQEQVLISRDIHHHQVRSYILPVVDVKSLPTKHLAPLGPDGELSRFRACAGVTQADPALAGTLIEISASYAHAHFGDIRPTSLHTTETLSAIQRREGAEHLRELIRRSSQAPQRHDPLPPVSQLATQQNTAWLHPPKFQPLKYEHEQGLRNELPSRVVEPHALSKGTSAHQHPNRKASFEPDAERCALLMPQVTPHGKERARQRSLQN